MIAHYLLAAGTKSKIGYLRQREVEVDLTCSGRENG